MAGVYIPVGHGELYDKISILEIKMERVRDAEKLAYVQTELAELQAIAKEFPIDTDLYRELKEVNERIWDDVGEQWEREVRKELDETIIQLARNVYILNDKRASIKKKINTKFGSAIVEVKSYASCE